MTGAATEDAARPHMVAGADLLFVALIESERDAAAAAALLEQRHPGSQVACVLSADLGDLLGPTLAALRPVLAEIICFDSLGLPTRTGQDTAMQLLESLGVGQDFVFTVADLDAAIDYALASTTPGADAHWEARAVLVVGPAVVVESAGHRRR